MDRDQISHWNTFGFVVLRDLFTPREMEQVRMAAQTIWVEDSGTAEIPSERQQVNGIVERSPFLTSLLDDDRVFLNVQSVLGRNFIWIGSDGSRYVGDSGWHSDGSNFEYRRAKILLYLEPLRRNSGCLRVIAGSHRPEFHSALTPLLQRSDKRISPYGVRAPLRDNPMAKPFGALPSELPCWAIETVPGDAVFFDQNIWHSSYGGSAGRSLVSMSFGEMPTNDSAIQFVKQMYAGQLDHVRTRQFRKREEVYGTCFLGDTRERIRELTARIVELDLR